MHESASISIVAPLKRTELIVTLVIEIRTLISPSDQRGYLLSLFRVMSARYLKADIQSE